MNNAKILLGCAAAGGLLGLGSQLLKQQWKKKSQNIGSHQLIFLSEREDIIETIKELDQCLQFYRQNALLAKIIKDLTISFDLLVGLEISTELTNSLSINYETFPVMSHIENLLKHIQEYSSKNFGSMHSLIDSIKTLCAELDQANASIGKNIYHSMELKRIGC
jgi:uncharacterized protein Yka (UPF0111/DUF47 family)